MAIPLTRLLVGTSISTATMIMPLSIATVPYLARVAAIALCEVDRGLVEAVRAMGGSQLTAMCEVLIRKALPSLVAGLTIMLMQLIGASAMAGAVGVGGLGDLAIRYGCQRFGIPVTVAATVVPVPCVALIQGAGDRLPRRINHR